MSNTKHSPAPWKCVAAPITSGNYYYVKDANGINVCKFDAFGSAYNAELTAAAPKLLVCLKDCYNLLNFKKTEGGLVTTGESDGPALKRVRELLWRLEPDLVL